MRRESRYTPTSAALLSPFPFLVQITANSSVYKSRMSSITTLVMGRATEDTVVYPSESEQFGGYLWGEKGTIFTFPGNNSDQVRTYKMPHNFHSYFRLGTHLRKNNQTFSVDPRSHRPA
jgi:hypothetical protein